MLFSNVYFFSREDILSHLYLSKMEIQLEYNIMQRGYSKNEHIMHISAYVRDPSVGIKKNM